MKESEGDDNENRNVFILLTQLRKEKLFITTEKLNIQSLTREIKNKTDNLVESTWITIKQRLYLISQREYTTQNYEQVKSIMNPNFIDAKIFLGFSKTLKIESLLHMLRTQPEQLAEWLVIGESLQEDTAQHTALLQSLVTGLYSSCIFPRDTKYMLKLLYELAKIQFTKCENPRRMLKTGNCSFRNLYFIFNEVLPSAKIFLSAALEMPILQILAYKEIYLDLNADKTLMRYKQSNDSLQIEFKHVEEYRNEVIVKLAEFTNYFINSLRDNVFNFPKSISWIVFQISKIISKSFGTKEANAIITELIFTLYICPAIVDPEQYSICDTQVTDVARHNLMQIAQILQILALNKFESPDSKMMDVYNLLDKDIVSNFIEDILFTVEHDDVPPVDLAPPILRESALFSEEELNNLILFLHKVYDEIVQNESLKKRNLENGSTLEEQVASLSLSSSLDNSPKSNKPCSNGFSENVPKRPNFLSLVTKNHGSKNNLLEESSAPLTVLVFAINKDLDEPVGFLSEDRVINMNLPVKKDVMFAKVTPEVIGESSAGPSDEKPSCSNYQDEGSIGNTSDNLEAISEAASNHSVASSLELENEDQNDNLSDMISANVSGRGTPNISGRDTPSSQVNENEERPLPEARQVDNVPAQQQISRQVRSEIDDKFCKFEIKKLLEGDETISVISETWSTDVLASDNETIDASDSRIDRQGLQLLEQSISEVPTGNILDLSETQSESAWSTDVMASDTERLTEVDNDDKGSVAQSDDANSVARSDDTRSETDENLAVAAANRRLSNSSNPYSNHVNSLNYQEYVRKIEIKNEVKSTHTDNNANNVIFKTVTLTDSQQVTSSPLTFSELKTSTSFNSNRVISNRVQTLSTNKDIPGPSGFSSTIHHSNSSDLLKQNSNFDERQSEILLSNCSLNSSSSGSSSNSFENKNTLNENCDQWENKQWLNSSGSSLNVTSTPSESTSELSVLSVNNLNNTAGNIITKKQSTVLITKTLKPSASTGAIPKSISFDMSADKGDKYLEDDHRGKRGSFFGKLKMGFKNRRGKGFRNHDDIRMESDEFAVTNKKTPESPIRMNNSEVSEDILAKYRPKSFPDNSPVKNNHLDKESKNRSSTESNSDNDISNSVDDIKKKLRLVLSDTNLQVHKHIMENRLPVKNKIQTVLKFELGKARKLKQWSNIARISETIRCINLLNESTCLALLTSMMDDCRQRIVYTQYLINSRQELLICESFLDGLMEQIQNEKQKGEEYLCMICVRKFLLEQEVRINLFCQAFEEISLSDEKCDYLNNFYEQLYSVMERNGLWKDIFKNRRDVIKITLERSIMSKVYTNALYPNGDGDKDRDHVLYQHIEKLSSIVTPDHKDLMIHKMFLREFPWIPAQDALKAMNAYKTPRDKVNCVVQCAKCIMDLLSFSQSSGSTTADDFTPVLVYVIITVNPRDLLSTIQFVNNFYQSQLGGEELYWWTQFSSAVEYIKTMDYSD